MSVSRAFHNEIVEGKNHFLNEAHCLLVYSNGKDFEEVKHSYAVINSRWMAAPDEDRTPSSDRCRGFVSASTTWSQIGSVRLLLLRRYFFLFRPVGESILHNFYALNFSLMSGKFLYRIKVNKH